MKQVLLIFSLMLAGTLAKGQTFDFQLTGNPVNTAGWTTATQSFVDNDQFVLTTNTSDQTGYVYYATPQNLTNCSQFTVTFEFRITNSSSPTADGLAFWYITNPPTGFTSGGGIGLPSNPDGLLLIMDTYDNNSTPDNPLISLRRLNGTANYTEGTTTGQLVPDLTNQTFVTNGNWHTCVLNYNFGTVTVAFDGNPPVMTGTTSLNLTGYFGFSAGTGALWARHAIRNVHITGAPEPNPPAGNDITYCQGDVAAPLTAAGSGLSWFTTPTGGVPLAGAPTPGTNVPGTFNWYVSQAIPGCNVESQRDTVTVTVNPKPGAPVIGIPKYCSGQNAPPLTIVSGTDVLWYTQATGGTGDPVIPVINAGVADTITWFVTQTNAFGCESDRYPVQVIVHQTPEPDFTYNMGYGCSQDTVHFQNTTLDGISYRWDFYDGLWDTTTHPSHIYTDQNTYYVKLVATNAWCSDSVSKPINTAHPLSASFTSSEDTVCVGTPISFTNTSTATTLYNTAPAYFWDFGDGVTSPQLSPTHTYAFPGVYQVMMVVKDAVPCSDTAYRTVYVDSIPELWLGFTDTAICQGDQVRLTAHLTQNGLSSLQWNFGDGPDLIGNENPGMHSYDAAGQYTVTALADYRACPDASATLAIRVKPLPVIHLGPDTAICLDGAALTLTDQTNAANPNASWRWNTGATTASIQVLHHGEYTATVSIDQCSASDVVMVRKDCYVDIPNSFTPNGDGVNDYFFPRQLLSSGVSGFVMTIYNRWGQKIFETSNPNGRGWDGRFNEKIQPMGVYIYAINVVLKNGRTETYTGNVTLLR